MLPQVLDSRLVSVAADKVWVGSGVGAPVLDMAETVPPGTRIARVLAGNYTSSNEHLFTASSLLQRTWTIAERPSFSTRCYLKRPRHRCCTMHAKH